MAAKGTVPMAAIVIGGTGATGKSLLRNLLQAKDKVSKVTLLSRSTLTSLDGVDLSSEQSQGRLVQHVEDLESVSDSKVKEVCTGGHVLFNCMGTHLSLLFFGTPSAYRTVAYDVPARLTKLAHQAGVAHSSVLTAIVSNPNSWSLYVRCKGQLEAIGQELFPYTSAFRAGMLDRGEDSRFLEKISLLFSSGLSVNTLSEAMFLDALAYHTNRQSGEETSSEGKNTLSIFYDNDIRQICRRYEIILQRLYLWTMATQSPSSLAAVVIGATGATGKCLVQTLLAAKDKVAKVTILGRRKLESIEGVDVSQEESEGRLVQHVQDLDEVTGEKVKELCTGSHVFFNCLGSTRAKAGSADAFRHIDLEIPVQLAKAACEAGVPHCSVVTSQGANPNSWFLYTQVKGQVENELKGVGFSYTTVFRPGVLRRSGEEPRFGEKLLLMLIKGMPVSLLAEAMFHDAWDYHGKSTSEATANSALFYDSDIRRICQEKTTPAATTE
ncbi:uncharacterized protein LOC135338955 [Halichondria panicea]|uniref:uncharacterized protein LOC135338955 n=1 Tax=Halichondria panicea TaxID=6063 RepID=UPI00312BBB20